jgi:hypothetical protein
MSRRMVLLPAPFGPTMAARSPVWISMLAPSSTFLKPKFFLTLFNPISIIAIGSFAFEVISKGRPMAKL